LQGFSNVDFVEVTIKEIKVSPIRKEYSDHITGVPTTTPISIEKINALTRR